MLEVLQYLTEQCGVTQEGVACILSQWPQVLLCKPSTNDRWDRRALELAAFIHKHKHSNIPDSAQELSAWAKRQRIARLQGSLSSDRVQILQVMGFDFGEIAQITNTWEVQFDQLLEWKIWHDAQDRELTWFGLDWGIHGGRVARQLAVWTQLQREYRRRCLLPEEAHRRLDAIGFVWEPQPHTATQKAAWSWMQRFGQLLYYVQQQQLSASRSLSPDRIASPGSSPRSRTSQPPRHAAPPGTAAQHPQASGHDGAAQDAAGPSPQDDAGEEDEAPADAQAEDEEDRFAFGRRAASGLPPWLRPQDHRQGRRTTRLESCVALELPDFLEEWLEEQRWLWRQGRLLPEQVKLFLTSGLDLHTYDSTSWRAEAHAAAVLLNGAAIPEEPFAEKAHAQSARTPLSAPQPVLKRQQHAGADAVWEVAKVATAAARPAYAAAASGPPGSLGTMSRSRAATMERPVELAGARSGAKAQGEPSSARPASAALGGERRQHMIQLSLEPAPQPVLSATGRHHAGESDEQLRIRQWVLTQRQLFTEGRLNKQQLRYMAALGLSWLLSDQIVFMDSEKWSSMKARLKESVQQESGRYRPQDLPPPVLDWLLEQKGLRQIGWLDAGRWAELAQLGVPEHWLVSSSGASAESPVEVDREWNVRLAQLLHYVRTRGHAQVPEHWVQDPDGDPAGLGLWLKQQQQLWRNGLLRSKRQVQLHAVGVVPPADGQPRF